MACIQTSPTSLAAHWLEAKEIREDCMKDNKLKMVTLGAEISLLHGLQHLQSGSRGLSVP